MGLAGKYGDGAILSITDPQAISGARHMLNEGARSVRKDLESPSNFYTTALTTMVVLDDGEAIDSDRVKAECGAMAMAAVHYSYDQFRNFGHQPPNALSGIWEGRESS